MIKPAASSTPSSSVLSLGTQASSADGTAVSGDFAALLESTLATGQDGVDGATVALDPALAQQLKQADGKPGGSPLPPGTLNLAALQAKDGSAKDAPESEAELAQTDDSIETILAGLMLPGATPPAEQSTAASLMQSAAARSGRAPLPTAPTQIAGKGDKAALAGSEPGATEAQNAAKAPPAPAPAPAATQATAASAAATSAAAPIIVRAALSKRPPPAQAEVAAPRASAEQLAARASGPEGQTLVPAAPASTKADPAATPRPREASLRDSAALSALPVSAGATGMEKRAATDTLAAATRPAAAPPQPSLVVPDAPILAQSAPATPSAPLASVTPAGHDFAALVDRLVDARQAAAPEAVHAAISHSDFGQVSLRFNQDANGLSVAMSSADPEFARAVQASTASAQSQNSSDNGSNAARQDGSGQQQQAAAGQAQSHNQSQSQASARNERGTPGQGDSRSGQAGHELRDDEPADTGGGIYA